MGKVNYYLLLIMLPALLASCGGKPSHEELQEMIVKGEQYPRQRDITLDIANVYHAAQIKRAKLDEGGYAKANIALNVNDNADMKRIEFTQKAKPFLIGGVEQKKEKSSSALGGTYLALNQKVATYKVDFNKILAVRFNKDENKAIVKYEAVYRDLTPFANVGNKDEETLKEGEVFKKEAYFIKYEDGWKYEKNPALDFLNF